MMLLAHHGAQDKDIQVKYVRGGETSENLLQIQSLYSQRQNNMGDDNDLKSSIR